ncbi:class I SAM-dependent methyltransferase [Algoriphagus sp.]|uniref:class I SAM-dependent methyltransferase n=1 Tax=Algoriphagus sp. TaxID=1872435 RepID=UPI003273FA29
MADSQELAEYYTNYYEKDHYESVDYKNLIINHFQRISKLTEDEIKQEAKFLKRLKSESKFLDVGCGLGLGLAYANQLNCELYATEFDIGALEFVKDHYPVSTFQGDIWEAKYPENHFDFIHISHVIEHVLNPKGYIAEMKRILKPGGFLAIGTPNMSSNLYRFHRWSKMVRMDIPDVIDGLEHTFIFPKKLLRSVCEEQKLEVVEQFTHNFGEKLSNLIQYKMPLKKKLNRLIQNAFQVNQWIVCRK